MARLDLRKRLGLGNLVDNIIEKIMEQFLEEGSDLIELIIDSICILLISNKLIFQLYHLYARGFLHIF